ncbi:MAG: SMI1/KNR4 family protein [Treponemataceae bacterium]
MDKLTWKYVKSLDDKDSIAKLEKDYSCKFSDELKSFLVNNNGGRPSLSTFDINNIKEREFKTLLSLNKKDSENIYQVLPLDTKYSNLFPFASDNNGNYFCYYQNKIYLWNHENDKLELLTNTFDEFLNKLY